MFSNSAPSLSDIAAVTDGVAMAMVMAVIVGLLRQLRPTSSPVSIPRAS